MGATKIPRVGAKITQPGGQAAPEGARINCYTGTSASSFCGKSVNNLDPVVQRIVSLTISLRHKFVKQISAKVTNTLLFFVEKM